MLNNKQIMEGNGLKHWLKDTGKDIAKAVGRHLAKKGIDYAKTQLGMGMAEELAQEGHGHFQYSAMMSGAGHDMDGDGIGHWLKESGKEVAKHVGTHLLKEFGKHAVSAAQEMLGQGIMDELKKSAKAVGASALGNLDLKSIDSKQSAKAAAKSAGKAAAKEGVNQLSKLASKYFGGAGTSEQAVKVCAYTLSTLRKIITAKRRQVAGLSVNDYLGMHAHRILKPDKQHQIPEFHEHLKKKPSKGGMTMKKKRKFVSIIKSKLHPPVGKLSRKMAVEYIFGTARELGWDWESFFENAPERKRVPKGCYSMTGPGVGKASATDVLTYRPKRKRGASDYNTFIKSLLDDPKFQPGVPHGGKHGRFARAASMWKKEKAKRGVAEESAQRGRDFRARNPGRIPKKRKRAPPPEDSDEEQNEFRIRAKMTSLGLPVSFK
eukprot:COSAG01_NODE_1650_length_9626_cov_46.037367_10_plen_434_part_00